MKRVTFAILCLLPISCFNLLAEQNEFHRYTHDGKVITDNSNYHYCIRIYLPNGEKIERDCSSMSISTGYYYSCYLTPVNPDSKKPHYELSYDPTDRLIITYSNDDYKYLWSLRDELENKGVHIIDYDLVYRKEGKWDSGVYLTADTYYPVIHKGTFTEEISYDQTRGFSIDPKNIKKIELTWRK